MLGQRWTFLIIRELLMGGSRFNELQLGRAVDQGYARAAAMGLAESASQLGSMYLHGVGAPRDGCSARDWFLPTLSHQDN